MRAILAGGGAGVNILTSQGVPTSIRGVGITTAERSRPIAITGVQIYRAGEREISSWHVTHTSLVKQFVQFLPSPLRDSVMSEFMIYISALGGETGTAVADSLVMMRGSMGLSTVCVFVLPFSAESIRRERAQKDLYRYVSTFPCVVFDNNMLVRLIPDQGIAKAMGVVNSLILESAIFLSSASLDAWKGFPAGSYVPIMGSKGSIEKPFLAEEYLKGTERTLRLFVPKEFKWKEQLLKNLDASRYAVTDVFETEREDDLWFGLLPKPLKPEHAKYPMQL
jgi:hypothetical protein